MGTKRDGLTTIRDVFLRNIGEESTDSINAWFTKSYANEWRIDRLKEAVELALEFKDQQVTIVGDYDADGMTSTAILYLALTRVGFTKVSRRIPKRFSEGFGINPVIIDEINEGLVITCDNGVAQIEAIQKAKDKGLTVIIIDHHNPVVDEEGKVMLPNADIIIDPHAIAGSADFDDYCGAGLSWRFARELGIQCGIANLYQTLIGLAAIGTVADVVELRKENYVIVRNGLKLLTDRRYNTVGVNTLVSATCGDVVTAHDIGFKIGPVINAASRMQDDGAQEMTDLLIFNGDQQKAIYRTEKYLGLNDVRKGKKREGIEQAEKIIAEDCMYGDTPLVIYIPGVAEGVLGIIASAVCDRYEVPAIILTDSEDAGILKGSARSCGNCNIKEELDKVNAVEPDVLYKYGGHEGAAGLSVYKDKLETFRATICFNLSKTFVNTTTKGVYDLDISSVELPTVAAELAKYEPFGQGNAPIVFRVRDFYPKPVFNGKYVRFMGDGTTVKLDSGAAEAVGFGMSDRFKADPKHVTLYGTVSYNNFNGRTRIQVEFEDFETGLVNKVETSLSTLIKERAESISS